MATFIQQLTHYPAIGKEQELRAVLVEWAKSAPSRGFRHNLHSKLGSEGPVFIHGIRHDNLTAYHTYAERSRATPGFAPFIAKMHSLVARPRQSELFQVLIPPPSEAPNPKFLFRVSRYPAIGKGPALRKLLEERSKAMKGRGFRMVTHQMFGSEGPVFVSILGFPDMESLEATLDNNQRDAKYQAYSKKIQSMLARPSKTELHEVLVSLRRG